MQRSQARALSKEIQQQVKKGRQYRTELAIQLTHAFTSKDQKQFDSLNQSIFALFRQFENYAGDSMQSIVEEYQRGFPSFKDQACQLVQKEYQGLMQYIGQFYTMAYVLDMLDSSEQLAVEYQSQHQRDREELLTTLVAARAKFAALKDKVKELRNRAEELAGIQVSAIQGKTQELIIANVNGPEEKAALQLPIFKYCWFSQDGETFVDNSRNAFISCEEKLVELNEDLKPFTEGVDQSVDAEQRGVFITRLEELKNEFSVVRLPVLPQEFFQPIDTAELQEQKNQVLKDIQLFDVSEVRAICAWYDSFKEQEKFSLPEKPQRILHRCSLALKAKGESSELKEQTSQAAVLQEIKEQISKVQQSARSQALTKQGVGSVLKSAFSAAKSFVLEENKVDVGESAINKFNQYLDELFLAYSRRAKESDIARILEANQSLAIAAQGEIREFCLQLNATDLDPNDTVAVLLPMFSMKMSNPPQDLLKERVRDLGAAVERANQIYNKKVDEAKKAVLAQCQNMLAQLELNRTAWIEHIEKQITTLNSLKLPEIVAADSAEQAASPSLSHVCVQSTTAKPTVAESLPDDTSFKLPSTTPYLWGSGISSAATVGLAVATVFLMMSHPVGWLAVLAVAALACCVLAVKWGMRVYERRQENRSLKRLPVSEQRSLCNQDHTLEQRKYPEKTRHRMLQYAILLTEGDQELQDATRCTLLTSPNIKNYYLANDRNHFFYTYEVNGQQQRVVATEKSFRSVASTPQIDCSQPVTVAPVFGASSPSF